MHACFGEVIPYDKTERGDRLLEEVFELLQSGGYDPARVAALRDYVWNRPAGEPSQEVGGVMVTLAAYCNAFDLDMHAAGETELARIWTKVEAIRAKQAAKPTGSALPIAPPSAGDITTDGPHKITDHRRWLARQLLDSQLSDEEAFGIVAHSPAVSPSAPDTDLIERIAAAYADASSNGNYQLADMADSHREACLAGARAVAALFPGVADTDLRERVARILDPVAYQDFPLGGEEPHHDWLDRERALAKAEEILALLPSGGSDAHLRERVAALEEGLKPLARVGRTMLDVEGPDDAWKAEIPDDKPIFGFGGEVITAGDLRRAAALNLQDQEPSNG